MNEYDAPRRRTGSLWPLSVGILLTTAIANAAPPVQDCAGVCGTNTDCSVTTVVDVTSGSTLDCSGRNLTINIGAWLQVTDGGFTLKARNLTVDGSAAAAGGLRAVEGNDHEPGEIQVELKGVAGQGNLNLKGAIRANGQTGGGVVNLITSGNILIENYGTDGIEAGGTGSGANGGEVHLDAGGTITIQDPIHAEGAGAGDTSGGTIEIVAGGNILIDADGHIDVPGRSQGAGAISIASTGGDVVIREHIQADGSGPTAAGGHIDIHAAKKLEIGEQMSARGAFQSGGGSAEAGAISLEGGCEGVQIKSSILATGGTLGTGYEGGAIEVESNGDLTVESGVVLDTHGPATGSDGGPILLKARNLVKIFGSATVDARGSATSPGRGGEVTLEACSVEVSSGALIDTTGSSGGAIILGATKTPPTTDVAQPLLVGTSAILRAKGATAPADGHIDVFPRVLKTGKCTVPSGQACFLNTDCVDGCQTGVCTFANPDTAGVNTQFDLAPDRAGDPSLTTCQATCTD